MCYFIHLRVTPEARPAEAESLAHEIANRHDLHLLGQSPTLTVTDGHCSCALVDRKEKRLVSRVVDLVQELARAAAVKSVTVGWAWGEAMPEDAEQKKVSVEDFGFLNGTSQLSEDVWYRVSDPSTSFRAVNLPPNPRSREVGP